MLTNIHDRYEGHWKDDQMHGEGFLTKIDGEVYKGSFVDGSKEGYGVYYFGRGDESEYVCPLGTVHVSTYTYILYYKYHCVQYACVDVRLSFTFLL